MSTSETDMTKDNVQEPVAWRVRCTDPLREWVLMYKHPTTELQFSNMEIQPLYTASPNVATPLAAQRQSARSAWVGLTQPEIVEGFCSNPHEVQYVSVFEKGARWAEAKLKEKNT